MDGEGRRIRRNSNAEVKGSKSSSAHPNRSINSLTASMDEGPRVNYSPGARRKPNGFSSSTTTHGIQPSKASLLATTTHGIQPRKASLLDSAGNGRRTTPKEGAIRDHRTYNYSKGISRNNTINLLEMSYRKGVSVDTAGPRGQNIAGTQSDRRNLFRRTNIHSQRDPPTRLTMEKFLHPKQGLPDPVAKPVTELEVRRSNLGKLANNRDRAVPYGACLRNEHGVMGSNLVAKCVELAMQWPSSADEIKCSISDVDMEIVAGSVADAVKAIVRSADMPSMMQIHAFRWARRLCDNNDMRYLAFTLKKEFDRNYGPAWHCIVGNSFGSFVTHSAGGFLCFSIQNMSILLFRTIVEPLEHI